MGQAEATTAQVTLGKPRHMETLHLHGGIRRNAAEQRVETPARLDPCAIALCVEAPFQRIAGKGRAFGGRPMLGEAQRLGQIQRIRPAHAVDTRQKCVARSATEAGSHVPAGEPAGQRKAQDGVAGRVIIRAGREAAGAGGEIVRAGRRASIGLAGATEGAPRR